MRIVGGQYSGIPLAAPRGTGVRPTSARVREALFDSLSLRIPQARILDLFSGTGAIALEALSRGAATVLSVEISRRHCSFIRRNFRACRASADRFRLRCACVFTTLRQLAVAGESFDLILADPPFGPKSARGASRSLSQKLLESSDLVQVAGPGSLIVVGHATRDSVEAGSRWEEKLSREYGDATLKYLRKRPESVDPATPPPARSASPPQPDRPDGPDPPPDGGSGSHAAGS